MSFQLLMAEIRRLRASSEALAALGAELRLRRDGASAHPETRRLLQDVVAGINRKLFDGITPQQEATALALIRSSFHYATDLVDSPARDPGWLHQDSEIIESQGRLSMNVVHQISGFAPKIPALQSSLVSSGAFLDIGTGAAWLAIEAARVWPALKVVGIDIWGPALTLARANIKATGLHERVAVRAQNAVDLDDQDAFTVVWYPGPFLPLEIATEALKNAYRALVPGGWLVFGTFSSPPDPLGEAIAALRIVRSGGYPWKINEVEESLRGLGFEEVESYTPGAVGTFTFGRKPG